jgi:uncharacterized membrane protein
MSVFNMSTGRMPVSGRRSRGALGPGAPAAAGMNAGTASPWAAPGLRIACAVAYPFLAHAASVRHSGALAACALGVLILMALANGLVQRRAGALLALAAAAAGLAWLAGSRWAQLPLLLVPVAFIAMIAWWFGRTLRPGRVPLISKIVSALERVPASELEPDLRVYTRRLTLAWALVLGAMGLCNLVLAAVAVPNGLLAAFGIAAPFTVTDAQWSWFANWFNYGLVGGFFVLEYLYRKRRFPGRYRNFLDFATRLSSLGPVFWRDLFR